MFKFLRRNGINPLTHQMSFMF